MFSSVALLSFLPGVHWISWHAHHRLLNPYHPLILRHKRYLPPTLSYSILHSCKYRYPSSTPPPLHLNHVESIRSSGPYEVLPPRTVRTRSPRKITSTRRYTVSDPITHGDPTSEPAFWPGGPGGSQNARFPYMPSIHPFSESAVRSPTNYSRAITNPNQSYVLVGVWERIVGKETPELAK